MIVSYSKFKDDLTELCKQTQISAKGELVSKVNELLKVFKDVKVEMTEGDAEDLLIIKATNFAENAGVIGFVRVDTFNDVFELHLSSQFNTKEQDIELAFLMMLSEH